MFSSLILSGSPFKASNEDGENIFLLICASNVKSLIRILPHSQEHAQQYLFLSKHACICSLCHVGTLVRLLEHWHFGT